jgi:hypothetical protein
MSRPREPYFSHGPYHACGLGREHRWRRQNQDQKWIHHWAQFGRWVLSRLEFCRVAHLVELTVFCMHFLDVKDILSR